MGVGGGWRLWLWAAGLVVGGGMGRWPGFRVPGMGRWPGVGAVARWQDARGAGVGGGSGGGWWLWVCAVGLVVGGGVGRWPYLGLVVGGCGWAVGLVVGGGAGRWPTVRVPGLGQGAKAVGGGSGS